MFNSDKNHELALRFAQGKLCNCRLIVSMTLVIQ